MRREQVVFKENGESKALGGFKVAGESVLVYGWMVGAPKTADVRRGECLIKCPALSPGWGRRRGEVSTARHRDLGTGSEQGLLAPSPESSVQYSTGNRWAWPGLWVGKPVQCMRPFLEGGWGVGGGGSGEQQRSILGFGVGTLQTLGKPGNGALEDGDIPLNKEERANVGEVRDEQRRAPS